MNYIANFTFITTNWTFEPKVQFVDSCERFMLCSGMLRLCGCNSWALARCGCTFTCTSSIHGDNDATVHGVFAWLVDVIIQRQLDKDICENLWMSSWLYTRAKLNNVNGSMFERTGALRREQCEHREVWEGAVVLWRHTKQRVSACEIYLLVPTLNH